MSPPPGGAFLMADWGGQFAVSNSFTTIPLNHTSYDTAGGFDGFTGFYTVKVAGYYDINAFLRVNDEWPAARQLGMGVDVANGDSPVFAWYATTGAMRNTFVYSRNGKFAVGDQVRLFAYSDAGPMTFQNAALSLSLIGR